MARDKGFYAESKSVIAYHSPSMGDIATMRVEMPSGREISFFVNRKSGLVVGDVVDKDGNYGFEFIRKNIKDIPTGRRYKLQEVVG